jgi:hypothetical protein
MHIYLCSFPTAVACETWTVARTGRERQQERNDIVKWSESSKKSMRDERSIVVVVSTAGFGEKGKVEDEAGDKRWDSDEVAGREGMMEDQRRSLPGGYIVSSESSSSASSGRYALGRRGRKGKSVGMRMLVVGVVLLWINLTVAV